MLKSRNVHYAASVTVTTLMQPITNVRLQVNKNYRGHQDKAIHVNALKYYHNIAKLGLNSTDF